MSSPLLRDLLADPAAPIADDEDLLKTKEAMVYLKVGRSTIYRLMQSGDLVAHRVGCTLRFYRKDLRACVREGRI